ncbi:hypothetical protein ACL6C3_05550 [Capilliphycus salinus ALCB114379]|uniref:hypothetical protein n=1 Tax=Capilliphycus salinus TaxID=2768948 RepID=UPI0039A6274E
MNALKKASIEQSIESSNLTLTEAFIMAIAMITALSLQAEAKSQNPQIAVSLEQDLPSLAECKTSEVKISNPVGQ